MDNDGTVNTPNPVPVNDVSDEQEVALAGIRTKLHRANSQLDRLYHEMDSFSDGMPYALGDPKPNADFSQWIYPLKFRRPIPLMWAVVLGEIIHDLRSALDHSIFQLTLDYTGTELGFTSFPISDKSANWIQVGEKKTPDNPLGLARSCSMYQIRGVGPGVVDYIKRIQPHSTQNPKTSALLALQSLWNRDKHRLVHFWGLQLVEEGSDLRVEGGDRAYTIKITPGLLNDGDDAITTTFEGPAVTGKLEGRLHTKVAFENPADPTPGVNDRLWRLHDATAGIVGTLLAAIGRQDEPIP